MDFSIWLSHFFNALTLGFLLALITSGLTLSFSFLNVINFAHGAMYMLAAYLGYQFYQATGQFWLALLVIPIVMGLISMPLQHFVLRRLAPVSPIYVILFTFGLALVVENVTRIIWGPNIISVSPPPLLSGSIDLFGAPFPVYRLFIIVFSALVLLSVYFILHRMPVGIIVRAGTEDQEMAAALGVNIHLVGVGVFGFGTFLAGLAGVIAAPYTALSPHMGVSIIVMAFLVMVIGGMTSFAGTVLSGLLVGFVQVFGGIYFSDLATAFALILMIIVILTNQKGLSALFEKAR
ncbi:MAG: hypothetical protein BAA01_05270 [Bacillus thermozeamaize]|jgi:branched-subunit amino acid ABC-type transport system permease component|uniref:ABC transporter permease n=1 Tax=Bacillus thermozeamaize TaxID=230954 RepID=A0A1Y3PMA8_9BACI|nr:MAG: hypothetical protein BAA01_05270 [Bacillus thermozeamaize]